MLALAAAGVGWWIVHRLNSARDRVNAERLVRTTQLSKAHAALVRAGIDGALIYKDHEGKVVSSSKDVEDAIGIIYLYGTPDHVKLACEYVQSLDETQKADAKELVESLRNHIRKSLGLKSVAEPVKYLRVKTSQQQNHNQTGD